MDRILICKILIPADRVYEGALYNTLREFIEAQGLKILEFELEPTQEELEREDIRNRG